MSTKKEIIIKILKELNDDKKLLRQQEIGLETKQYGDILDTMLNAHLLINVTIKRGGTGNNVVAIEDFHAAITIDGMEYLEHNLVS